MTVGTHYQVRGEVVLDPTDLRDPFPFGGKELGHARAGSFAFSSDHEEIDSEEVFGSRVDYLRRGYRGSLTLLLGRWDSQMLDEVFPNLPLGESGQPVIPGLPDERAAIERPSHSLLIVSEVGASLLLHEVRPAPSARDKIQLSVGASHGVALAFVSTATEGRTFQIAALEDMTL